MTLCASQDRYEEQISTVLQACGGRLTVPGPIGADTSFLIDFFNGEEDAVSFMGRNAKRLHVSELVIFEFLCGNLNSKEIVTFLGAMKSFPTVPFERDAATIASTLFRHGKKEGKSVSHADCLIAGSYLSAGIKEIATKNIRHFKDMKGITLV